MKAGHVRVKEKMWAENFGPIARLLQFSKHLKNSRRHLDFGCGTGIFLRHLAEAYPDKEFIGFDIDEEKLAAARSRYSLPNITFTNQLEGTYDSVSLMYVIHDIEEHPERVLAQISDHMDPKSLENMFLVLEFKRTTEKRFRPFYETERVEEPFETYYARHNRWTEQEFEVHCKAVGFETLTLELYKDFWFGYVGKKE
ncbi:class I SAM-dependent methyltransferase [archaeon]|jgi:trans-aconitate methyltransferase|nr:class I SAM-dependent methyltransferase [archaeon]MBT4397735.1 class I SAM-dependent methyltransferase [archaeon]MBT4441220.1 class I SAM-dependent methyltransferase [archaeon]